METRKVNVKIKRDQNDVKMLIQKTDGSAGFDIHAYIKESIKISPNETANIPTGIRTEMPLGKVALIYSRSGLATKRGLVVCQGTGVIDSDYRGEWYVPLHNISNKVQEVSPQERIAQVIFTDYIVPDFKEVEVLSDTERGGEGFGSTGEK